MTMKSTEFIPFNKPLLTGSEQQSIQQTFESLRFSGDGKLTLKCHNLIEQLTGTEKSLLTTSCTDALELSALALNIKSGDEVIMPSYTFVSTANAFALRGAKIIFVDIEPDTMNISPLEIEKAITKKTKAIVLVHYAGVSCDMEAISKMAQDNDIHIIEDAAQCVGAYYKDKHLGSLGDFGTLSFHETKNIHCGEGGAILINNKNFIHKCEVAREKGTNRSEFLRGQVDKYSWKSLGSSFLPNELSAAFLAPQLENIEKVTQKRIEHWSNYYTELSPLEEKGIIELTKIPNFAKHNAHLFYLKTKDLEERTKLSSFLRSKGIQAAFHYAPLHKSEIGKELGHFSGEDQFTSQESDRLLRLPLFYSLTNSEIDKVITSVKEFYKGSL